MIFTTMARRGLPFYDPTVPTRAWSMRVNEALAAYDAIEVSDDRGASWTTWLDLPAGAMPAAVGAGLPHFSGHVLIDSAHNAYWAKGAAVYRADGVTKEITQVITLPAATNWYVLNWGFTEGLDGYLYIAAYNTFGATGAYIWVSPPGGAAFVQKNPIAAVHPGARHVHSLGCNPYDGRVYVLWGDTAAWGCQVAYTTDRFVSLVLCTDQAATTGGKVIQPKQYTNLTFTPDGAAWFGSDTPGASNQINGVWKLAPGDTILRLAYLLPGWDSVSRVDTYSAAGIYSVRARGNDEIWLAILNEGALLPGGPGRGGVIRLRKPSGSDGLWNELGATSEWVASVEMDLPPPAEGGFAYLSQNGRQMATGNFDIYAGDDLVVGPSAPTIYGFRAASFTVHVHTLVPGQPVSLYGERDDVTIVSVERKAP